MCYGLILVMRGQPEHGSIYANFLELLADGGWVCRELFLTLKNGSSVNLVAV